MTRGRFTFPMECSASFFLLLMLPLKLSQDRIIVKVV